MASTTSIGFPIRYETTCQWGKGGVKSIDDQTPCLAPAERRISYGVPERGVARTFDLCSHHLRTILDEAAKNGHVVQ